MLVSYCVTFGGYVGLSSFLPLFLRDQLHVAPVTAGSLTALAALVGSGARPFGGYLADRIGGLRLLQLLLLGIATGVIGAVGGHGGFLLPTLLGGLKQRVGSFAPGFVVLGLAAFAALLALQALMRFHLGWRSTWRMAAELQAAPEA